MIDPALTPTLSSRFRKRFYTRGIAYTEQHRQNGTAGDNPSQQPIPSDINGNISGGETAHPHANGNSSGIGSPLKRNRNHQQHHPNGSMAAENSEQHGLLGAPSHHESLSNTGHHQMDSHGQSLGGLDGLHPGLFPTGLDQHHGGYHGVSEGALYPGGDPLLSHSSINYAHQSSHHAPNYTPFMPRASYDPTRLPHHQPLTPFVDHQTAQQHQHLLVRERALSQEQIDAFLQRNRHRVYPCRKCRLHFPCREYLSRHMAWHSEDDAVPHACDQCPQRFASDKLLQSHFLQHGNDSSPHRCLHCFGNFRSALALRRHRDACRQCASPYGSMLHVIPPTIPLDQYAFVDSGDTGESGESVGEEDDHDAAMGAIPVQQPVVAAQKKSTGGGSEDSGRSRRTNRVTLLGLVGSRERRILTGK